MLTTTLTVRIGDFPRYEHNIVATDSNGIRKEHDRLFFMYRRLYGPMARITLGPVVVE